LFRNVESEEITDITKVSYYVSKLHKIINSGTILIYFNKTFTIGMHCFKWITWILVFSILINLHAFSQEKILLTKVVIDAGHGGKDPGALGRRSQEKNITLQIALKLGELIREGCRNVKVYYTRDKDEFIELHQRAGLANRVKADLFISIHCNSNPSHTFRGAETYIMGLHKSEANLAIAKQENASILMETDYTATYNGFDPNSDESYIVFSLYQDAFMEQSRNFATIVQDEMKNRGGLNDRGVRQAGFLVLYKTTMPSVLVETGFLSNAEEEKFLLTSSGQDYIASAIFKAFKKFKEKMEGTEEVKEKEVVAVNKDKPAIIQPKKDNVIKIDKRLVQNSTVALVAFRVQVAISAKDIGIKAKQFEGLQDIKIYKHQGLYKYTTGDESSLEAAIKLQEEVQRKGFKDAFVVAFQGDERITIAQAKKLIEGK
jgi:N-acetylmuramoyl-L-alanine amidase